MLKSTQDLIDAVTMDARQTWPEVTRDMMHAEAQRLLDGGKPRGGPYMMLADAMHRAGVIKMF